LAGREAHDLWAGNPRPGCASQDRERADVQGEARGRHQDTQHRHHVEEEENEIFEKMRNSFTESELTLMADNMTECEKWVGLLSLHTHFLKPSSSSAMSLSTSTSTTSTISTSQPASPRATPTKPTKPTHVSNISLSAEVDPSFFTYEKENNSLKQPSGGTHRKVPSELPPPPPEAEPPEEIDLNT